MSDNIETETETETVVKLMTIPMPEIRRGNGRPAAECPYPFEDMMVGDSMVVQGDKKELGRARNWAARYQKENEGYKFATRSLQGVTNPDTNEVWGADTIGVWRVEITIPPAEQVQPVLTVSPES